MDDTPNRHPRTLSEPDQDRLVRPGLYLPPDPIPLPIAGFALIFIAIACIAGLAVGGWAILREAWGVLA